MFKTIFSKYLTTFTVILVVCIIAILLAVSSRISREEYEIQKDSMDVSSGSTALILEGYLDENGYDEIYKAFSAQSDMQNLIVYFAQSAKADIYVFDYNGVLVAASNGEYPVENLQLSEYVLDSMINNKDNYAISAVDGLFQTAHFNSYHVAYSHNKPFIVLASRSNYSNMVFNKDILIVAITVALWMFLAAMIALYVISRRTTEPLSEIVVAAKDYSKGRFDKKIEVTGQDEVAELAVAINNMASSLKQIDADRNSFLGNVSHDLRTPMTTIAGFVDGILDGTIPPEKHEYYLNIISQEVRRLSRLVNTLLEVSRMESGTDLKPIDFNLSETARAVLISLESKISNKKIDIDFDTGEDDVYVNADPDSIHRVIFNLMDNAVKFTPEKGKITIKISTVSDGRKKRKALFVIRNTGEGIPAEKLPHVFDRFYKIDSSRGLDKSGTGLGLYIAKTSVKNHGEDLTVDSVSGEYAEFRFNLPTALVEPAPRRLN